MGDDSSKMKSLDKALSILECFNEKQPELGITQISQMLSLNKSNVYNVISTFENRGYMEKNEATGKYKLGMNLLRYSFMINESLGYQRIVYDIMQDVSNTLNGVTYFAVPHGNKILYLYSAYPETKNYEFPFRTIVGAEAPYHCTSLGKAMLAFMKEEDADKIISGYKERFTENTITEEKLLRNNLREIQAKGYSIDKCEHEYGVKCMGVPILAKHGQLFGAISLSGPESAMPDEILEFNSSILKEAAFRIKERL